MLERAMGLCQDGHVPLFFPWMAAVLGLAYTRVGRVALAAAIDLYRAMAMTFWLPQTEATLAQVEA
jgi:hypothetical protein